MAGFTNPMSPGVLHRMGLPSGTQASWRNPMRPGILGLTGARVPQVVRAYYYRLLRTVEMIFVQSETTAARRRVWFYLVDATDGITPETAEGGGQPQISKNGGAWANTSATLTAVGNGTYYVELTAGELDTLGKGFVRYKSGNTAEFSQPFDVVAANVHDTVRLGLTSLPNAAAEASGGLYTRGSGQGQINQDAHGRIDVNLAAISTDTVAADNAEKYFDGSGFAEILQRTTINALSSQTSFTLTAGSTDNDAYNGCVIVIEDASTVEQKAVGVVLDYTGVTRTVTLLTDPAVFTMAASDIVTILADRSVKPTVDNRTLDVTATGAAGIDWSNIENSGSTVSLSATTVANVTTVATVTALAANAITASSIATDAIGSDEIASTAVAEIVNAFWDELTSESRTAGSYGQLLIDNVNTTISSRSSHAAADVWAVATREITGLTTAGLADFFDKSSGLVYASSVSGSVVKEIVDSIVSGNETYLRTGTAQSGTTNTITLDSGASSTDGQYKNAIITLTGGTGSPQTAIIDSYNGTTKVATVTDTWAIVPDSTTVFKIFPMGKVNTTQDGAGALTTTIHVQDDGGNPIDGVAVWMTTDEEGLNVVHGAVYTDAMGDAVFYLDAGTYYSFKNLGGWNFTNPQQHEVS
jgi:hypothetical protein